MPIFCQDFLAKMYFINHNICPCSSQHQKISVKGNKMSVAASFYLDIILDDEQSDPVSF
jgi:hypothetical protein